MMPLPHEPNHPIRSGPQVLTSAALYAIAFIVTTMLHELAHALASLAFGGHPVIYQNSVDHTETGVFAAVSIALAGPLFSLVQGAALLPIVRRWRDGDDLVRAATAWLCFHGLMNAAGYLFTTCFAAGGDLGKAMRLLGVPVWGLVLATILGFGAIRVAAQLVYPAFAALLPLDERHPLQTRNRALVRLCVLAWPIGALFVLPTALPLPHWLSLVYVALAGMGTIWFTDFSKKHVVAIADSRPLRSHAAAWPWVALAVLEAFSLIVLRPGIHLG